MNTQPTTASRRLRALFHSSPRERFRYVAIPALLALGALTGRAQTPVLDVSGGRTVYASALHQEYLAGLSNITAEVWVNTTESTGPRFFFAKYVSSQKASGGEWYMGLGDGGQSMKVQIVPAAVSGSAYAPTFNLPDRYDDGEWHHFAFTYNQSKIEAFYDGDSLGTYTGTTGAMRTNTVDVNFGVINNGASPASDANSFIGLLAEARIWNTIRTANEIRDNMDLRLEGTEPGLVGCWRLDEGTGTEIADRTANHNDGTVYGAQWVSSDLVFRARGTVVSINSVRPDDRMERAPYGTDQVAGPLLLLDLGTGAGATLVGGDFNLQAASPCRDAGDSTLSWLAGALDLNGKARIEGSDVDLGCFQYKDDAEQFHEALSLLDWPVVTIRKDLNPCRRAEAY